ncbi:MAG: DUF3662 domain-containing protein [Nocardioidaceae bacterium]|nr:DUF3662 domain-containing protein [Nocardioidaceae bacterium]
MSVLQRFEQRLERAVSGAFARVFRSAVQPVEIAASITREIDNSTQVLSRDRVLVPNAFSVELSPGDYDRLAPYGQTLSDELDQMVRDHVREQHYTLAGPVVIDLVQRADLTTGRFLVTGKANAAVTNSTGGPTSDTSINRAPVVVEVNGARHAVPEHGLVMGRGDEADLRINDPGVSRRHAEIRISVSDRQMTVSVVDLGSTNGTQVDGRKVQQAMLRDGSTIVIGGTTVTVHDPRAKRQ